LNIDRDSFNRFHPAFRMLQDNVHQILQDEIFPKVYEQIDKRSKEKAKRVTKERTKYVKDVLEQELGKKVELKKASSDESVNLKITSNKAVFRGIEPSLLKTKKAYRELASAILTIYETSQLERTSESRRDKFQKLLLELFSNW